jgi:subtilase family serine protease
MKSARIFCFTVITALLVAALPSMAQPLVDAASVPPGHVRPPIHVIVGAQPAIPTGIFPGKMRIAYGFNNIKNYGKGQTIAIVDAFDNPNVEADLATFNTTFKFPACTTANGCFQKVYATGVKPPSDTQGWGLEMALDVQWAHVIAPQAKIMLVEAASNSFTDMNYAVDVAVQMGASVVSMSYGGGEYATEVNDDVHYNVPGVTFVASSGDSGTGAQYPAASPYVVGVGGTTLTINSTTGAYVSETAWSGSGGGVSRYETAPAYQSGIQTGGRRGIPDIAFDADPATGVPVYNTFACGGACPTGWVQVGGTSLSAPCWAGLFAIANSQRAAAAKTTLTQPQFILYPAPAAGYHDITTGSNGSCLYLCKARPGYDFVTGLGTPKADLVIPALVAAP